MYTIRAKRPRLLRRLAQRLQPQPHSKAAAAFRAVGGGEVAAVALDNALAHPQAQAIAVRLVRSEKRLKQLVQMRGRDAGAGVATARANTEAAPPPMAWAKRAAINNSTLSASQHARLATVNKAMPANNTGRRP
jgi:hypothetical protein